MTRLKKIRIERNMTQQQLAHITGIKQPNVCRHESRGVTQIKTAKTYARALNCEWIDLIEL